MTFAILRIRQAPARRQRESRFYGSHTRAAWVILWMISLVVITLLIYRGAQINTGVFPFGDSPWAFASWTVAKVLAPLGQDANEVIETVFLLANVAVILGFLVIVTYSKHLHIALAPLNVGAKRVPDGLGPLLPVTDTTGKPIDFADAENLDEDQVFGRGKVEDFTWKGMLDFATCTECGRCQSQCPAWNTGKPLSPEARDHGPARPPVRQGAVPPRRITRERHGRQRCGRRRRGGRQGRHGRGRGRSGGRRGGRRRTAASPSPGSGGCRSPARPRPSARWSAPPRRAA